MQTSQANPGATLIRLLLENDEPGFQQAIDAHCDAAPAEVQDRVAAVERLLRQLEDAERALALAPDWATRTLVERIVRERLGLPVSAGQLVDKRKVA